MTRHGAQPKVRRDGGYALIFALAVMLVVLIIGFRFIAVVHSRQQCTNTETDALQAALIADGGLERVARELSQDMSWSGTFTDLPLAGGTYTAGVSGQGAGYVTVSSQGTYRSITIERTARVYTPSGSGTVHIWGSSFGTGDNEWHDKANLIDWGLGESDAYANHKLGEGADQMSLAGFGSDIRSATITKVEVVISGYVDTAPVDDHLQVNWHLAGSATTGPLEVWDNGVLDDLLLYENRGRIYLDITSDSPAGGWQWRHFYHGTDLELRFASFKVGDDDHVNLYVDCAGFRVTWDAGL